MYLELGFNKARETRRNQDKKAKFNQAKEAELNQAKNTNLNQASEAKLNRVKKAKLNQEHKGKTPLVNIIFTAREQHVTSYQQEELQESNKAVTKNQGREG